MFFRIPARVWEITHPQPRVVGLLARRTFLPREMGEDVTAHASLKVSPILKVVLSSSHI